MKHKIINILSKMKQTKINLNNILCVIKFLAKINPKPTNTGKVRLRVEEKHKVPRTRRRSSVSSPFKKGRRGSQSNS